MFSILNVSSKESGAEEEIDWEAAAHTHTVTELGIVDPTPRQSCRNPGITGIAFNQLNVISVLSQLGSKVKIPLNLPDRRPGY